MSEIDGGGNLIEMSDHIGDSTELIKELFAVELHGGIRVGGINVLQDRNPMGDLVMVQKINVAHEKAVREAVEEFRERAARVCEDSVTFDNYVNICTKSPNELAAEIRSLRVEEAIKRAGNGKK